MNAAEKLVRKTLEKVKGGNPDAGLEMTKALHHEDPKPLLFHYVVGLTQKQKGDMTLAAGAFRAFSLKLAYRHSELIGLTKPGEVDPESLQLHAGPGEMREARKNAQDAFAAGDWKAAVDWYSKEIMWRIDVLKQLGFDVFVEPKV